MNSLLYTTLAAFLVFIPFGSAPIYIGSRKLDNMIGFFLVLFLMLKVFYVAIRGETRISVFLFLAFFSYILISFISAIFSSDALYSLTRFSIIFGYAFVAVFVPPLFYLRAPILGNLMLAYALLSSAAIWVSYWFLGMPSWGRMTIPTWHEGSFKYFPEGWGSSADPNMLGVGLLLSLIFGFTFLKADSGKKCLLAVFCISAALMTLSRTAFLGLLAGMLATVIIVLLPEFLKKRSIFFRKKTVLSIIGVLIVCIVCGHIFLPVEKLINRFTESDSRRLEIIESALINWGETEKTLVIGVGFDKARTLVDPHNIYLTVLHDSGVIGLLMFLICMSSVFVFALSIKNIRPRFFAVWIFFFIAIAGLTYWHTKTFWVSMMFVLLIWYYERFHRKVYVTDSFSGDKIARGMVG